METLNYTGTIVIETCCSCNMKFGMDRQFYNECRDKGISAPFYCPAGHKQWYATSRLKELEQTVNSLKETTSYLREANSNLHSQVTELKYSNRALKAAKTKIMNRVKNGVCPCCNRHFDNLQGHFKSKHPELFDDKSSLKKTG